VLLSSANVKIWVFTFSIIVWTKGCILIRFCINLPRFLRLWVDIEFLVLRIIQRGRWLTFCCLMQTKELITEISMLEEEVTNREQYILSLYRNIFDQCIAGSLSTQNSNKTSPAHANYEDKNLPSTISRSLFTPNKFPPPHHYVSASNQGFHIANTKL